MMFRAWGLKAWLILLVIVAVSLAVLVFLFRIAIVILPIVLVILGVIYLWRMLTKVKKEKPKDYVDAEFKVKKE